VGQTFTIEVQVAAGAQPADGVEAHLGFDPGKLQVVDINNAPANAITPGTTLPQELLNVVDNAEGWIDYAAGAAFGAGNERSGTFSLATIRFKALGATGETGTPVKFTFTPPRKTEITGPGAVVVLRWYSDGNITITP